MPRPVGLVAGRSLGGSGLPSALQLIATGRFKRVVIIERTWDAVDRTRCEVDRLGDDRISVRHSTARPLLPGLSAAAA